MPIKLVTLNIEGDKHLQRFVPVLQTLHPDAVCFQEIFKVDCPNIARELGMQHFRFVPSVIMDETNKYGFSPKGEWGIAIMSKLEIHSSTVLNYGDRAEVPVFEKPNDDVRWLLVTELQDGQDMYRVATTHFTWTPAGEVSEHQRRDFEQLKGLLMNYEEMILCGDFNAPRGKEIFTKFTELYQDNVPPQITTTIDPILHYAGHKNLQLVVDAIFTSPHYSVSEVKVLSGVSDHMGIYGVVDKVAS